MRHAPDLWISPRQSPGPDRVELSRSQRTLKRAFDLVASGLLVVGLAPVLVACSMVRHAEERQPALRAVGNEADGPLFKLQRDPRVTRVGRVLRAWSLDELPQLLEMRRNQ
jgi:lipopolysaccharide/colanic/teichoic acid biosynthesis glycosyltransferase